MVMGPYPAVFSRDGKGLQWRHTFFAADFMAEVMQVRNAPGGYH